MMETIVGLLWGEENLDGATRRLLEIGVPERDVRVLSQERAVRQLLGGDIGHPVLKHAAWGALLGIATFAPLGVGASLCECTFLSYGPAFGAGILVAFVVIGAAFGAFMGHLFGLDASECGHHLYSRGVCMGGRLVAVQVDRELAEPAMSALQHSQAIGVRAI